MKMLNHTLRLSLFLLLTTVFAACEKEELPVTLPPIPEGMKLMNVDMTEQYNREFYINLIDGRTWQADNDDWDLQFESSPSGSLIYMNGGREVLIASTGYKTFKPCDPTKMRWRWDGASGMRDSTVLANCFGIGQSSHDSVYMIDRGVRMPKEERYFLFKVLSVNGHAYEIEFSNPSANNKIRARIQKDRSKAFVYFSFNNGGRYQNFEPNKDEWHIRFKRYRWIYYEFNPPLLYTVVGVHINTGLVQVAMDSTLTFNEINKDHAVGKKFSSLRDVIGFTWKWPDFTPTGVRYMTRSHWNYFIEEKTGSSPHRLFKLRFIDFYNDHGVKGTPRFEYQQIR